MNIRDAASYLAVHPMTLYRLLKARELPAFKVKGRWQINKDVLDEWIINGHFTPPQQRLILRELDLYTHARSPRKPHPDQRQS